MEIIKEHIAEFKEMAVKTDYKTGDKVVFINAEKHEKWPQFYPKVGTVGTVVDEEIIMGNVFVKWTEGSTSERDTWYCDRCWLVSAEEY